jgi:hypothetical protein
VGFSKLKKWPKSIQGCRRYKPKRVAVAFSRAKVVMRNLRMFCIWPQKGTSACFGLNLCHPWMDLYHFFNFENPVSIFYKFYFVNVLIQSFWKELQHYQSVSMLLKNQYFIKMLALHVKYDISLVVNAFRGKISYFVHQQYSRGTPLNTETTQGGFQSSR